VTRYSLDTDHVTAVLKKDRSVSAKLQSNLELKNEIVVCPYVYYEIRRILLARNAQMQLSALASLVAPLPWLEFNKEIWLLAAEMWASARSIGVHHQDPDLLIACHALYFNAVVVTGNTRHFKVHAVGVENWRGEPEQGIDVD
jgi:predicted nucleic acid-binding protein